MIVIFGHKDFKKFWEDKSKRKKFCSHDILIADGSGGSSKMLNSMNQIFSIMNYSASGSLLNGSKRADPYLDRHVKAVDVKKKEKNFFGSYDFIAGTCAIAQSFVEKKGELNIAVVIEQDSYDALSKKYVEKIEKILHLKRKNVDNLDDAFEAPPIFNDLDDIRDITKKADVIFRYKDIKNNPDILKRVPSKKELKAIRKGIEKAQDKISGKPPKYR